MTAPASRPSGCHSASWAASGSSHAGRVLAGDEAAHEVLPTELVMRGSTGRPAAVALTGARRTGTPAGVLMGDALRDRVVLVTGGSRGIGAEVAVKAAAEGAIVAVHYRTAAPRPRNGRSRGSATVVQAPRPIPSPRTSPIGAEAEQLVERVIERFGRIDGLVNNAGLTQVGPFLETTTEAMGRRHPHRPDRAPSTPARPRCRRWSSGAAAPS